MTGETDSELFAHAISDDDNPAVEPDTSQAEASPDLEAEAAAEQQPVTDDGRDPETGRFAAKAKEEPAQTASEAEQQGTTAQQDHHRIPLAEHLAEREKRQAAEMERETLRRSLQDMERRIAELSRPKEPAQAPDPYADPRAFVEHNTQQALNPIQQQMDAMRDQFSRMLARREHGAETVEAAYSALEAEVRANPAMSLEARRMWQSEDPYGEVVNWYKSRQVLKEIGTDPDAYRQRLREELQKDPEFIRTVLEQARASAAQPANGQRPQTITQLPPSLSRTTAAAPNRAGVEEMLSDRELFDDATRG